MVDAFNCARCDRLISSAGVKECAISTCVHLLKDIGFKPAPIDMVNHPPHYRAGDIYETIRVIEAWELNYNLGNTVKYISRASSKGDPVENLEKARWYLTREIETLRKAKEAGNSSPETSSKDEV